MAAKFDLVLLHGPPFSGQDVYFKERLSKSHKRVCPEEIFLTDPNLGLRDVVLCVARLLKEGNKVIIDDGNGQLSKRQAYVSMIRKKMPTKTVALVKIYPKYGEPQCQWCREFHWTVCGSQQHSPKETIGQWFDPSCPSKVSYHTYDEPKETEGFQMFSEEMPLTVFSRSKLETPALFIQWEGMVKYSDDTTTLQPSVVQVCQEWADANKHGHIILLQFDCGSSGNTQEHEDIEAIRNQLADKVDSCPIFHIRVQSALKGKSSSQSPKTGILAHLQKRHCLNLFSKNTVYLYHHPDHLKMAESCGIKTMKMSRVLMKPALVLSSHMMSRPVIPKFLEQMVLSPESGSGQSPPDLPLYDQQHRIKNGVISQDIGHGRTEFLFVRDKDQVERFQEVFQQQNPTLDEIVVLRDLLKDNSTKTEEPANLNRSHSGSIREIPSWMMGRTAFDPSKSTLLKEDSSKSNDFGVRQTLYMMSEKELREVALEVVHQAGREDILERVRIKQSQARKLQRAESSSDFQSVTNSVSDESGAHGQTLQESVDHKGTVCDVGTSLEQPQKGDDVQMMAQTVGDDHEQSQRGDDEVNQDRQRTTDVLDDLMTETHIRRKSPKKGARYRRHMSGTAEDVDLDSNEAGPSKVFKSADVNYPRFRLQENTSTLVSEQDAIPIDDNRMSDKLTFESRNESAKKKPDFSVLDDIFL